MKKFTKKVLMDRLDFTEDEAKLIMEAQRMFPELLVLDSDEEGYIIDGFNLWEQLGRPQTEYGKWAKRKIINKGFIENTDFLQDDRIVVLQNNGHKIVENHKLTLDTAKNIAMMENTHAGALCRRYFILMEKAVKKMSDWVLIREPQKQGYKDMSKAIRDSYMQLHSGEEPNQFVYINNADMINLALLGHKSKAMKELLEIEYNNPLRDHITLEVNKALYELQQLNENLLYSNVDFNTRKSIIETTVKTKYTDVRAKFTNEFAEELSLIRD